VQVTSQAQESSQVVPLLQDWLPVQATVQRPVPQTTSLLQDSLPPQVIEQALASLQSTPPLQEPLPVQFTVQGMPVGQTTSSSQASSPSQVMTQVPSVQVPSVQAAAQALGPAASMSGAVAASIPGAPSN